jgi:hypothetical protein
MAYDTSNSGTLGKNHRKEKDTHPSHTGKCEIDGKAYWISAWVKDGNNNEKFFSLSFKLKDDQPARQAPAKNSGADDDIPF